ncbi:LVIVD repeat-containing protein [Natronococcus wangiae]|uniref:hypothetical protein n=1 Tax=Natronococcus wangiae TaxID=3068275 RepID=UPI00273D25AA|nr:hypothetical protein [Natronococcus sp. AD5]
MTNDTNFDGANGARTGGERTRRAILEAAGATLGVAAVGGVASGHPGHGVPLGDPEDPGLADDSERTEEVGYHSLGGVGPASLSGSEDEPHYGGLSELRVHDDLGFVTALSSRDETPGRGLAVFDVSDFTRAESRAELEHAELTCLSFVSNDNPNSSCMDVKVSDDGEYVFVCKQPVAALSGEYAVGDADDHDTSPEDAALLAVDVSDPGNPMIVSRVNPGIWALGPHNCWHHQIGGQEYVFTAHGADGVTAGINVFEFDREAESLAHVNFWKFGAETAQGHLTGEVDAAYAHDIAVQDDPVTGKPYGYVSYWNAGTWIVDLSDPADVEPLAVFEMDRSHHTVPVPTLLEGKRLFVSGHENPDSTAGQDGDTGFYYLVDADGAEGDGVTHLGRASNLEDDLEPGDDGAELDRWIFNRDGEFENFVLSAHNLDIDVDGRMVAGHYCVGAFFYTIDPPGENGDGWSLTERGFFREGKDVPEESTRDGRTTATPYYWSAVLRNGVTFPGGINSGAAALAHDEFPVGEDTPVDAVLERESNASIFAAGQTSQVRIHVDADEPVRVRDRIPVSWKVVGGDVSVDELDGYRTVVTFDEEMREGTLRYYVQVPDDETDGYRLGPVEYARPSAADELPAPYGGGATATHRLWRTVNDEIVDVTVAALDL